MRDTVLHTLQAYFCAYTARHTMQHMLSKESATFRFVCLFVLQAPTTS